MENKELMKSFDEKGQIEVLQIKQVIDEFCQFALQDNEFLKQEKKSTIEEDKEKKKKEYEDFDEEQLIEKLIEKDA